MSKHTPGPWRFCISSNEDKEVPFDYTGPGYYDNPSIYGSDGTQVVGNGEYYVFNSPEDARLMAAAPELLESGKKLVNEISGIMGAWELRALIGDTNFECLKQRWEELRAIIAKAEGRE